MVADHIIGVGSGGQETGKANIDGVQPSLFTQVLILGALLDPLLHPDIEMTAEARRAFQQTTSGEKPMTFSFTF